MSTLPGFGRNDEELDAWILEQVPVHDFGGVFVPPACQTVAKPP